MGRLGRQVCQPPLAVRRKKGRKTCGAIQRGPPARTHQRRGGGPAGPRAPVGARKYSGKEIAHPHEPASQQKNGYLKRRVWSWCPDGVWVGKVAPRIACIATRGRRSASPESVKYEMGLARRGGRCAARWARRAPTPHMACTSSKLCEPAHGSSLGPPEGHGRRPAASMRAVPAGQRGNIARRLPTTGRRQTQSIITRCGNAAAKMHAKKQKQGVRWRHDCIGFQPGGLRSNERAQPSCPPCLSMGGAQELIRARRAGGAARAALTPTPEARSCGRRARRRRCHQSR